MTLFAQTGCINKRFITAFQIYFEVKTSSKLHIFSCWLLYPVFNLVISPKIYVFAEVVLEYWGLFLPLPAGRWADAAAHLLRRGGGICTMERDRLAVWIKTLGRHVPQTQGRPRQFGGLPGAK